MLELCEACKRMRIEKAHCVWHLHSVHWSKGNSLRGIDKKIVRREEISIYLLIFSSQEHKFNKETKWFEIAVFLIHIFFQKLFSEWKPTLFIENIFFKLKYKKKVAKTVV